VSISLKPAHLKRYKDVAWLFFKYGRSDLIETSGLDEFVEPDGQPPASDETPKAADLAADLEKMGPTFVKLGQLLSTRPDLLPVAYIEALTRLQDKVAPFPYDQVEKIIQHELGIRVSKAFSSIESKPLAAASLGQVHRAVMRDGREVVVKIQRPGIREQMIDDLDSLHEVAEFLDAHTKVGARYEFVRLLDEFRQTLLRELDYRQEAQNLVTLGRNLHEFQRLIVPQPIEDYTTSRILTMEFVGGQKITALSPLIRTEIDGAVLSELLFRAYLKQILVDGFFHADPHPGNVLLTQDSSIVLLDLGMVARLTPKLQDGLLKILLAISEGRGEDVAANMIAISEKRDDFNEHDFIRIISEMVARHKDSNLNQISAGRVVMEISKTAAECGVRPPPEFMTLGKTLLNLDLLGTTLDPEFNPNDSIRRNATSLLQRRLIGNVSVGNLYANLIEAKEFVQHLPGRINTILDLVARNELSVKVDAIDDTKLMSGFQKIANRITVGLLLASMIIGAALLTRVPTTLTVFGYPILAMLLFMGAAGGALVLLFHILFHDEPA